MNKTEHKVYQGKRKSKKRQLVYETLAKKELPVTAEEIFMEIALKDDKISLSTVYRALEAFMADGIVQKTMIGESGNGLFEVRANEHKHYLMCVECKKMLAIKDCPLQDYENQLEKTTKFKIKSHQLQVYGVCEKCQKN